MKRLAFYGGSFDPVHIGHLEIGRRLLPQFQLDRFIFVPAFHAPHKRRSSPTSSIDRYAMLCLATQQNEHLEVSKLEIDQPDRPYTVQTLERLNNLFPDDEIFFVMGADSWDDITTWFEWEKVLSQTNHIVVTRPGYEIGTDHVTPDVASRIRDTRGKATPTIDPARNNIYFSDAVSLDVSASSIRRRAAEGDPSWRRDVTESVANYIEKYQIYK